MPNDIFEEGVELTTTLSYFIQETFSHVAMLIKSHKSAGEICQDYPCELERASKASCFKCITCDSRILPSSISKHVVIAAR